MGGTVLVAGALGVVGRASLDHYAARPGWRVIGLARRPRPEDVRAEWIAADLKDREALRAALAGTGPISHVVYAALHEEPGLVSGWTAAAQIAANLAMLTNLLDCLPPGLRHLTLLQGTKAYGVHHGPYRMPARESDPRFIAPNFYYEQEDLVRVRSAAEGWAFTVLRPQIVCGFALTNPMNAVMAIGVYAAICAELGQPMRFPGGPACFQEAVDSELLTRAIHWAGETPSAAGEIFNVANGDCFSWPNLWPGFARRFGAEPGVAHPFSLATVMEGMAPVWDRIVARHDLKPHRFGDIVASWQFMDYLLRHDRTYPHHSLVSTIKIRKHGFHDCEDSEEMFHRIFGRLQDEKILPGRPSAA